MFLTAAQGIPSAGSLVGFLTPVVKSLQLISVITLIGLLLSAAFFIREEHGSLTKEARRINTLASVAATVWAITTLGALFTEISNLLASPIGDSFDPTTIRSFTTQTALGKSYLITFGCALVVLLFLRSITKVGGVLFALAFAFSGLLAPIFQSHSSSAGNHGIAIGSLLFHVIAISTWVGGVIGLSAISASERELAIPRFSSFALWAAIITSISGTINAWTRLNSWAAWNSFYALLVLIKIGLTVLLIGIGYKHRKYISAKLSGSRAAFQLLTAEAMIMVMTVAIGGWLSTTQPPQLTEFPKVDAALSITGLSMQPAPTLGKILWSYIPDGTFLGLLILLTALYIRGVVVLSRRGDKWPKGRTIAFIVGVAAADFATSGGIGIYAHFAFSYHMIAHMILGMIAPIGFVLSAPITLALRTLPIGRTKEERGIRQTLLAFLHSRYSVVMTNPIVALGIFDGSLFVLYMTPLFGHLMKSHTGHLFMNLHFLLAGILFFYVIVGIDPNPKKIPYLVRIIILFAAMSIHAFFSVALMSSTSLVDSGYFASLDRPWNTNLLADQRTGGAIGWAMGEIPILIALIATFIQWSRDDSREARRIDRAADRADAMGLDDELAKYNRYLRGLDNRSQE
jgi:putative copper resistance protein D